MNVLTMPTLHVGQGTNLGGLSVFPIWTDAPVVSGLDTGTAARVQVDEREGSPVVGELVLKNDGAKPALLVAGELFEGGWQHRALNNDILLLAGEKLVASVSCVEHGRWHGATAQVRRSRRASMMVRSAQTIADEDERQGQVWERVSRYDMAFGASPTASYVDHLNRRAAPSESSGRTGGETGDDSEASGHGHEATAVEVFASTSALRRHLPGLLEAAAIDAALMLPEPTPGRRARRFVERLATAPLGDELDVDAGAGHALASRSEYHEIRGLGWDDHLLHATVFNRRHHLMEVA
jgi:hypothetical protein